MGLSEKPFYWKARKAWYIHVVNAKGKRSSRKLADKRQEAFEEYEKLLRAASAKEIAATTGDRLFAEVSEAWLARQEQRLEQGEVSLPWLERVTGTMHRWNEANPNCLVSQMTPAFVQAWLDKPSANYERTQLQALKQCLRWAKTQAKMIQEDPLADLKLPAMTRREGLVSTEAHAQILAVATHIRPLVEVAWLAGCRPGELRKLKWSDLSEDLTQAILLKHKTARTAGRPRIIVFSPPAAAIIEAQPRISEYVFLNSRKKPWTSNAVVQAMRKISKVVGSKVTAGQYRHTFTTSALVQGVPIATVSQLLGHSSTAMVSRVYGHLSEEIEHLKKAATASIGEVAPLVGPPRPAHLPARRNGGQVQA